MASRSPGEADRVARVRRELEDELDRQRARMRDAHERAARAARAAAADALSLIHI